jgi:hypothetical protein
MTPEEAATLMIGWVEEKGYLDHEIVTWELRKIDKSLLRYNEAGNEVVAKEVLDAFKKAMPDSIVWSRGERHWRSRKPTDKPGRMQD